MQKHEESQKTQIEKKEIKEEEKTPQSKEQLNEKPVLPPKRRIVIETDGNIVTLVEAQVAGNIELIGILQGLIDALKPR